MKTHADPSFLQPLSRFVTARSAMLAVAYSLLVVSCDSPLGPDAASVSRIELSPDALSLVVGDARSVTARVIGDGGNTLSDRRIFWASQNPSIATVSQAGIVTGIVQGSTQVAVSAGGKSGVLPVTVSARPVSLVRVTPTAATVQAGATVTLAAQALDAAGVTVAGRAVSWTTSSATIATVTSTGVVTGVTEGNATISATVDGVVGSGLVTVQPVPVSAVAVTPATGALIVGQQVQLTATPTDAKGNTLPGRAITWSSNAPVIASVSSTGLVTALASGSATITATTEGKSATARIIVSLVPVDSVGVTPRTATLAAGQSVQLTARVVDSSGSVLTGRTVTWASDQPTIATVAPSGLVTGVSTGQARISATADGKTGTATVDVTPVAVASLSITPTSATVLVGNTQLFTAVARDAQGNALPGRTITWITGSPSVATVTQAGLVTAVGTGSALIFAASEGVSASVTVTVSTIRVAQVRVQPSSGSISQGQQLQLTASAVDANGQNIPNKVATWTSTSDAIITVSSTGLVTGVSPGQATIIATIDGVLGTATLAVAPLAVASVIVSPNAVTLVPGQSLALTVSLRDSQGKPISIVGHTIIWSSTATTVVTVNTTGNIAAVGAGTATILATTEGVTGTATITVTGTPVSTVAPTPTALNLTLGASQPLTFTVSGGTPSAPLPGRSITVTSTNPAIASVNPGSGTTNSSGQFATTVTAVGAGSTTINATAGGVTGAAGVAVTAVPIASISLAPAPGSVVERQSLQLTATVRDPSNNILVGRTLVWSSSNNTVASVSQTGVVTANIPGSVSITAEAPGGGVGGSTPSGASGVTVTFAHVASVQLVPATTTISVNLSTPLNATLFDGAGQSLTAAGRTVAWRSLDNLVASVNSSGVVTGVTPGGPVGIEVSAASPGQSPAVLDTSFVTVTTVPVASVTITPGPNATLHIGDRYKRTFTALARDASGNILTGRTFTWGSDVPAVATVGSSSGVVTGIGTGSADIVATTGGVDGVSTVTVDFVLIASATVALSPASQADSAVTGNARTYAVTPLDSANNIISGVALGARAPAWSIASGSSFAGISASGANATVTALSPGTATVQADYGAAKGTTPIRVLVAVNIVQFTAAAPDSFFVGGTGQVTATALDASGASIPGRLLTLSSATPSAASLGTSSGIQSVSSTVNGVSAPGGRASVVLTATAPFDTRSSSATVKVLAPVNSITVTTAADSIYIAQNVQALALVRDASNNALAGRPVTWRSVDPLIATVATGTGVVTGVAPGSTALIAEVQTESKSSPPHTMKVLEPVQSVALSAPRTAIRTGDTFGTAVTLTGSLGNTLSGRVIAWSSSASGVLSVNTSTGVVTAVSPGTAVLTASAEGKTSPGVTFAVTFAPIQSVTMTSPDSSIYATTSVQATVVARDTANTIVSLTGRSVVWSSTNPAKARVSSGPTGGLISAVDSGTTNISVSVDAVSTPAIPLVVALVPVATVTVSPNPKSLFAGDAFSFSAVTRDSVGGMLTGRGIAWSLNNGKATMAPVLGSATTVTAADSGSVVLSAASEGKTGASSITISLVPIDSIESVPPNPAPNVTILAGGGNSATITFRARSAANASLSGRAFTVASNNTAFVTVVPVAPSRTDGTGNGQFVVTLTSAAAAGHMADITITIEGKSTVWKVTVS